MFRINWRSKITGYESHGEPQYTQEEAEEICKQENRMFPEIDHWAEEIETNSKI